MTIFKIETYGTEISDIHINIIFKYYKNIHIKVTHYKNGNMNFHTIFTIEENLHNTSRKKMQFFFKAIFLKQFVYWNKTNF